MIKCNRLWMIVLVAGVAACNKDDVIESGREEGPVEETTGFKVYEYTPAPGQFINENLGEMAAEEAALWAQRRIEEKKYVSLGAFGGYIVFGFGKPVSDFKIRGNAFDNSGGSSNEPGIVYVMYDTNGNGAPDDEWCELRGSETGKETTLADYSVTYFRPSAPSSPVKWKDSLGMEGDIDYLGTFHKQDYYYPSWIKSESYTLKGTRLADTSERNESGMWLLPPRKGGYVDNIGDNDDIFHASDAMKADGSSAGLSKIDFIKVQTGVCGKCGVLGEMSTEILEVEAL